MVILIFIFSLASNIYLLSWALQNGTNAQPLSPPKQQIKQQQQQQHVPKERQEDSGAQQPPDAASANTLQHPNVLVRSPAPLNSTLTSVTKSAPRDASAAANNVTIMTVATTDRMNLHVITKYLLQGKKLFLFQRNHKTGFGAVMLTFFTWAMYFDETQQRQFIFDDSFSKSYRKNQSLGMEGFFHFKFPVINTEQEYDRIFEELKHVGLGHLADPEKWRENMWNDALAPDYPILRIRQFISEQRFFNIKREAAFKYYNFGDPLIFKRLSSLICDSLWFNKNMLSKIRDILSNASIPDFALSASPLLPRDINATSNKQNKLVGDTDTDTLGPTIAFHVRRGDKVYGKRSESRLFLEKLYVDKFLSIPHHVNVSQIQHCFVATDEYNVTTGLQSTLRAKNISCQLHFLVPPYRDKYNKPNRTSHDDSNLFFTELYMLTHATYFVGSFNSNVGAFVAPFRGCFWKGTDEGNKNDDFHHFFYSYGVDREKWFIRK